MRAPEEASLQRKLMFLGSCMYSYSHPRNDTHSPAHPALLSIWFWSVSTFTNTSVLWSQLTSFYFFPSSAPTCRSPSPLPPTRLIHRLGVPPRHHILRRHATSLISSRRSSSSWTSRFVAIGLANRAFIRRPVSCPRQTIPL